MTTKRGILSESQFIELSDSDLKEALGALWERLKALKEAEGSDPEVERMRTEMKAYIDDNFRTERKDVEKKLRAGRVIAKSRNLRWKLPGKE
jgi:translation elongation factor EF-Ts